MVYVPLSTKKTPQNTGTSYVPLSSRQSNARVGGSTYVPLSSRGVTPEQSFDTSKVDMSKLPPQQPGPMSVYTPHDQPLFSTSPRQSIPAIPPQISNRQEQISTAAPEPISPIGSLVKKVLPASISTPLIAAGSKVKQVLGLDVPSFSDQMKKALQENPNATTAQLEQRARELDTQMGITYGPDGKRSSVDPTGALGSVESTFSAKTLDQIAKTKSASKIVELVKQAMPGLSEKQTTILGNVLKDVNDSSRVQTILNDAIFANKPTATISDSAKDTAAETLTHLNKPRQASALLKRATGAPAAIVDKYAQEAANTTDKTAARDIIERVLHEKQNADTLFQNLPMPSQHEATPAAVENPTSLEQEALKYNSAEEFVKSQELYHGTSKQAAQKIYNEGFKLSSEHGGYANTIEDYISVTDDLKTAENFAHNTGLNVDRVPGGEVITINKASLKIADPEKLYPQKPNESWPDWYDRVFRQSKKDGWDAIDLRKMNSDFDEGEFGLVNWKKAEIMSDKIRKQLTDVYNQAHAISPKVTTKPLPGARVESVSASNLIPDNSLYAEARKYKSAEEFVKAQPIQYHGSTQEITSFDLSKSGASTKGASTYGSGVYLAPASKDAEKFGSSLTEVRVSPDAKLYTLVARARESIPASKIKPFVKELPSKYIDANGNTTGLDAILAIGKDPEYFKQKLLDAGYDGVQVLRNADSGETVIYNQSKILTKSQLTDIWNKAHGNVAPEGAGQKLTPYDTPEVIKARQEVAQIPQTASINTADRIKLRNDIVAKVYGTGAESKERRLDIVMGVPAAGKSSVLAEPLARENRALLADSDEIKKLLPEYSEGKGSAAVHEESARMNADLMFNRAFTAGDNVVYPTVGNNLETLRKFISIAKESGYTIYLHLNDVSPEKAAQRAVSRFEETGRFVDPDYVLNRVGLNPSKNYDIIKTDERISGYEKYSNDVPKGSEPRLLESHGENVRGGSVRRSGDHAQSAGNAGAIEGAKVDLSLLPPAPAGSAERIAFAKQIEAVAQDAAVKPLPRTNNRGTKNIDQLLRMLDREKQSLKAALDNPQMHEKAYGPGKVEEYRRNIKNLTRRIEEDPRISVAKDPTKLPPQTKPLEHRIDPMILERSFLEDAIDSNPAKELAKYANRFGEIREATGTGTGVFSRKGDDIAHTLGYENSEAARAAYDDYLLQKERLFVLNKNIRMLQDLQREMIYDEKDARSLERLLNKAAAKTEKMIDAKTKKRASVIETPEQLAIRKHEAAIRMNRILAKLTTQTPPIERETLGSIGDAIHNAQPLTLEEFDRMNADSIVKTVIDTSTPVKDKINIIDYFRTPDRVLQKIGLGGTAARLRHAYESYLAELPAHIDTITAWSKRVPGADSNRRIFRYLDGQRKVVNHDAVGDLRYVSAKELEVAREIRAYLSDWADRLGLPPDQKITHYITHIFSINEIEKEFDEDVAKLIKDQVPGSVYDPFLEKRLGRKGYIEDTWAALDAYAKRAVRKANMDPVLARLKESAGRMEESQATYIKRYADLVNMRPTETDTLIDNLIKTLAGYRFGQRPVALITRTTRQWVYRAMLGLNVGSAIKNLTQGVNTFAILGTRDTLSGYIKLLSRTNSEELEAVGILKQDFVQDRTLSSVRSTLQKADKGLFMLFDTAEKINRGAAYFGAKTRAMRQGKSELEAIKYAKKIVRDTQFQFGSIDTPVALNSDLAKVISQFMTFGVKQAEFAAENIHARNYAAIIRYIGGALFMTYVVGKAFNINGQDFIPGYSFTKFGTPPVLALPLSIVGAITDAPDRYGNKRSLSKKGMDILSNVPFPASVEFQKILRDWKTGLGLRKTSKKKTVPFGQNLPQLPAVPKPPRLPKPPQLPKIPSL